MNFVPLAISFGAGIFFTIALEVRGLTALLEPYRDVISIILRVGGE